jgi:TetR/AcrR family fatty acid metabolism transcriptional regulator
MTHESKATLVEEYRRDSILSAAMSVIARKGVSGATMQEIADEARIAKGTIYLYFPSREELVEKAGDFAFSELLSHAERILGEPRPLEARLRDLIAEAIAFFDKNQEFLRVLVSMRYGDDCGAHVRRRRRGKPQYQRYLELLGEALQRSMHDGEIRRGDPERLATFFAEGLSAILMKRLSGDAPPADQEGNWIVELLWNGVALRRRA